jgi:hypothetical protein
VWYRTAHLARRALINPIKFTNAFTSFSPQESTSIASSPISFIRFIQIRVHAPGSSPSPCSPPSPPPSPPASWTNSSTPQTRISPSTPAVINATRNLTVVSLCRSCTIKTVQRFAEKGSSYLWNAETLLWRAQALLWAFGRRGISHTVTTFAHRSVKTPNISKQGKRMGDVHQHSETPSQNPARPQPLPSSPDTQKPQPGPQLPSVGTDASKKVTSHF